MASLVDMLKGIDDPNQISEVLKGKKALLMVFPKEEVEAARRQFEDAIIPALGRSLNREGVGDMVSERKTLSEDELRRKVWEEPNIGDHLLSMENALARGFSTVFLGTIEGACRLAEQGGAITGVTGLEQGSSGAAEWARTTRESIDEQIPPDPRMHWVSNAAYSGIGQAPAQLATALATPVNAAANFAQVYGSEYDRLLDAEMETEWKNARETQRAPEFAEFATWKEGLKPEQVAGMQTIAAWKALAIAAPSAAIETIAEKFLVKNVPWDKLPGGRQVRGLADQWMGKNPGLPAGARIFADKTARIGMDAGTEMTQQGMSNLGEASVTGDVSNLTKGVGAAGVTGAAGAGVTTGILAATESGRQGPKTSLEEVGRLTKTWMEAETPADLKASQDALRGIPLADLTQACAKELGMDPKSAESQALQKAAELTDATMSTETPAYHNRKHAADVVLAYTRLAAREPAGHLGATPAEQAEAKGLGLVAAVLHDIGHPGGNNTKDFELEAQSVELADRAGVLAPLGEKASIVRKTIMDTAFKEAAAPTKEDYEKGKSPLSAILRHADIFRSVYINKDAALESGRDLKKEFMESTDRCPSLKAPFVQTLDTPNGQIPFAGMNPSYLKSPEGARMEERRAALDADLKAERRQLIDAVANLPGPEKVAQETIGIAALQKKTEPSEQIGLLIDYKTIRKSTERAIDGVGPRME